MKVYLNSLSLNFISNIKDRVLNLTVQNQKILAITSLVFAIAAAIYIARRCWNKTTVSQASSNPLIPDVLAKIFKERSCKPEDLPVLNIKFPSDNSFYNSSCIQPGQMKSPLMRFTDGRRRHGIALHIKGKNSSTKTFSSGLDRNICEAKKINEVWFFYQPHASKPNDWLGTESFRASDFISYRHLTTDHTGTAARRCANCPKPGSIFLSKEFFESLLTGQDPDLQLGNDPQFNLFAQA